MEEYKITKEQVLKMAEKCPSAKEVLKVGFPDAFKNQETNVSKEIKFEWREDGDGVGPLIIRHNEDIIGSLFFSSRDKGYYFEFFEFMEGSKKEYEIINSGAWFKFIKKG